MRNPPYPYKTSHPFNQSYDSRHLRKSRGYDEGGEVEESMTAPDDIELAPQEPGPDVEVHSLPKDREDRIIDRPQRDTEAKDPIEKPPAEDSDSNTIDAQKYLERALKRMDEAGSKKQQDV